jgi:hypothetical protein
LAIVGRFLWRTRIVKYITGKKCLKIIRICQSKNRHYNGQKKKDKRANNDPQNTTQKTKDWSASTLLKGDGEHRWSGRVDTSCSTSEEIIKYYIRVLCYCCLMALSTIFQLYRGTTKIQNTTQITEDWATLVVLPLIQTGNNWLVMIMTFLSFLSQLEFCLDWIIIKIKVNECMEV